MNKMTASDVVAWFSLPNIALRLLRSSPWQLGEVRPVLVSLPGLHAHSPPHLFSKSGFILRGDECIHSPWRSHPQKY